MIFFKAIKKLIGIFLMMGLFFSLTAFSSVQEMNRFYIHVNGKVLVCECADNSSSKAILEKLKISDVEIDMSDYGNFEKVGDLGFSLPQNNEDITTAPGDVILYLGSKLSIYYAQNSWNLTRIGKIRNQNSQELKDVLGKGAVKVRLSLSDR
ncbi:cyclophilin-like fold protein [Succinivibrio dextrinosolvens]|uniref:cyclophilin-like fold protein n=1 Tax=Succinivibrio dextrinosolvens TaxID=83771 RepID=UPI0004E1C912|nr:cyclophilin-like fold protein [Succinivibrio dextrinosolvens]